MTMASKVCSNNCTSGTLAPAITTPNGPPAPSTARLFFVPDLPRSVGLGPVFFPEAGFAQTPIHCLPLPLDAGQRITFFQQNGPQLDENRIVHPALKPPMNRAIIAKYLGQMIPLTPRAQPKNNAVDGLTKVNTAPTGRRGWLGWGQNQLQAFPGRSGDFPDRFQGNRNRFFLTSHKVTPLPKVYLSFGKAITSLKEF